MNNDKEQQRPERRRSRIMTIKEVSAFLKIPVSTVYELANKGQLRGAKFGKHWRFLEDEIIQYLRGLWTFPDEGSPA